METTTKGFMVRDMRLSYKTVQVFCYHIFFEFEEERSKTHFHMVAVRLTNPRKR